MLRLLVCAMFAAFVVATVSVPEAVAQKKKVEVSKLWRGHVDDDKAMKPDCIVNTKGLETVWKAWKIAGDVPKIDFEKDIVVVRYNKYVEINQADATLDDKGNLEVTTKGTVRPGFSYLLCVVSREGVKTVNKKALPND